MLIAILLPWLSLILQGRLFAGLICLFLQCTLIGWIPAALWAVNSLNNKRADKRTDRIVQAIKSRG
jgi:uncharacterized membrane protein YqaE (UPF0057 family)